MNTALLIASAIVLVLLTLGYVDWRRFERDFPERRFKGPAPIRYIKHMMCKIVWGFIENLISYVS